MTLKHANKKKKAKPASKASQYSALLGLSIFIATFLAMVGALSFVPKTYETSATLLIRPMETVGIDVQDVVSKDSLQEKVNNQRALITSDQTAQRANDLLTEFLQTKACDTCSHVLPQVKLSLLDNHFATGKNYAKYLQSRISVRPEPNSHVVKVKYRSDSDRPEDFRTLLSLYLSAFQMEAASFGQEQVNENLSILQEQLELAKEHLANTNLALNEFRNQHKTLDPNSELNGLILRRSHLQTALSQAQAKIEALKKSQKDTKKALAVSVPTVQWLARLAQDDQLVALRRQLIKVYTEKAEWMSKRAASRQLKMILDKNDASLKEKPVTDVAIGIKVETVDAEIRQLNELIQKRIESQLETWKKSTGQAPETSVGKKLDPGHMATVSSIDVELALKTILDEIGLNGLAKEQETLKHSISALNSSLKGIPTLQKEYAELNARVELAKDTVRQLELEKSRIETLQPSNALPQLVMLKKPYLPLEPASPDERLLYGVAALLALLASLAGIALFRKSGLDVDHENELSPRNNHYEYADNDAWEMPKPIKGTEWQEERPVAETLNKKVKPDKPVKAGWWPFNDKAQEKKLPEKSEKMDRKKLESRILPRIKGVSEEDTASAPQKPSQFKLTLSPLPDLSAFIQQMEGDFAGAVSSSPMKQLQGILLEQKHHNKKRIGIVPISSFVTSQATLLALSLLLAESGQKTLLTDLDFSDRSLSRWLSSLPIPLAKGLQEGSGLSEFVDDMTSDFIDIIYPLGKSVYGSLIPAGHVGSLKGLIPSPLVLQKLLPNLSPQYDFVLYALPALEENQSALKLGLEMDGIILINHPGITKPKEADQALKLIEKSGIQLLGIIDQP